MYCCLRSLFWQELPFTSRATDSNRPTILSFAEKRLRFVRLPLHLSGKSIIQFGLLLLIATPVARVIFSFIGFVIERDYLYMALTLIVLAVLLYSLIGSGAA